MKIDSGSIRKMQMIFTQFLFSKKKMRYRYIDISSIRLLHHFVGNVAVVVVEMQLTALVNQRKMTMRDDQLKTLELTTCAMINFYSYSLHARIRPNLRFHTNKYGIAYKCCYND